MSSIINNYPVFEDNQVLTASQLNRLSDYLDQQTRLTRSRLIGMGIGCGLEINFDNTTGNVSVTLSKGIGVTSEGFLIDMPECILTKYRVYNNPPYVPFDNVLGQDRDPNDPRMWELLPADATPAANDIELNDDPQFLNDKAIVLFLECVDLDNKACLGNACDEIGQSRTFTLRKLVIYQQDLQTMMQILQQTDGCPAADGGLFAQKYDANNLLLGRPFFDSSINNYFEFADAYLEVLTDSVIGDLFDEMSQTYVAFEPILEPLYGENPFNTSLAVVENAIKQYLEPAGTNLGFNYFGIQYLYDALKDIIKAMEEFRNASYDLISQCCANSNCFPKHLVLGEATSTGDTCLQSATRTHWVSSAMTNNQQRLLRRVLTLHKRLVLMVEQLNMTNINNPVNMSTKITPSCEKKELLARREIPFYYNINTEGVYDIGTLEQNWNPTDTLRCSTPTEIVKVSYLRNQMSTVRGSFTRSTNISTAVANPLQFELDAYNFYRMGAVHNKSYDGTDGVSAEVVDYGTQFNLPFKVVNLSLVQESLDELKDLCNFEDLNTQFYVMREDIKWQIIQTVWKFRPSDTIPTVVAVTQDGLKEQLEDRPFGEEFGTEVTSLDYASSLDTTYGTDFVTDYFNDVTGTEIPLDDLMIDFKDAAYQVWVDIHNAELRSFDLGLNSDGTLQTGAFLSTYLDSIQAAINLKAGIDRQMLKRIEEDDTGQLALNVDLFTNIFQELLRSIDRYIYSSFHQKLIALMAIYQYRLDYLAANDPRLFSDFIKKHPGIEHGAGVKPGGTYILLHPGAQVNKPQNSNSPVANLSSDLVMGDFYLPYTCCNEIGCGDIPAPSDSELDMPLVSIPVYIRFSNGVQCTAVDVSEAIGSGESFVRIDVEPDLIYNRSINVPADIILTAFNDAGDSTTGQQGQSTSPIPTNGDPNRSEGPGEVGITYGGKNFDHQVFYYRPPDFAPTATGVYNDTFDYYFAIGSDGKVGKQSNSATVSVTINLNFIVRSSESPPPAEG